MRDINNVGSRFMVALHPSLPHWNISTLDCLLTTNDHLMNFRLVSQVKKLFTVLLPSLPIKDGPLWEILLIRTMFPEKPHYTCGELSDYYGRLSCHNILRSELFIIL